MTYHGPKVRLSRQVGVPITPKAAKVMLTRPTPPGEHGRTTRRRTSQYGDQLREKQKLRYQYNIGERQLVNSFQEATRRSGNTGENLICALECRLDAIVLRSNFARTIYQARQAVVHRHIRVNGRRVDRPSYRLKVGDVVDVAPGSREICMFTYSIDLTIVPPYLDVDATSFTATLLQMPVRDQIPVLADLAAVVEFYNR